MANREFEIELDSRRFQVLAWIAVHDGVLHEILLDDVSEWLDDDGPAVRIVPEGGVARDLCTEIYRQLDADTIRDVEADDWEAAREQAVDSQISAWKENR